MHPVATRSSACVVFSAVFLTAHAVTAQPVASLDQLASVLTSQTSVDVTTTDGKRVRGTLASVDRNHLRLATAGREIDIRTDQVRKIETRRRDSLWNGLLIGAGVGAALGLIPDYYDDCEECHDSLYGSIAAGAGVGLLIDALRSSRRVVYEAPTDKSSTHVGVAVGRESIAVRATLRWR
jgi:ElaB/YqjD/DUF883 family membrane-anchored ribosome-binding protein